MSKPGITEESIEQMILELLEESTDRVTVRMAIDFLKIKRADDGMKEDLDVTKYLRKAGVKSYEEKYVELYKKLKKKP